MEVLFDTAGTTVTATEAGTQLVVTIDVNGPFSPPDVTQYQTFLTDVTPALPFVFAKLADRFPITTFSAGQ